MSRNLTPKQAAFVREYLVDLNATQAAIRAGYSEKSAARIGVELLNKTHIAQAVATAQAKRARRVEVTQDYVLSNLVEIVERTMQRAPVTNRKGEQIMDEDARAVWTFDAKGANKALELLGKHLGIFTDKVQTEVSGGLTITWQK
jgi:phage terminase small subunit